MGPCMPRRRRSSTKGRQHGGVSLSLWQRRCLLLLILPLLWLMYVSWQHMSAALYDYQTQRWLTFWAEETQANSAYMLKLDDYHIALASAKKAVAKQPQKGGYLTRLAAVYDWYVMRGLKNEPEYQQAQEQSLMYFRLATKARPLWPEAWFDLAVAKARQAQFDGEFTAVFMHALILGPWEERLQTRVAELSFVLFDVVGIAVQSSMQDNWRRMAQHQPSVLLSMAKKSQALPRVCPYFSSPIPRACVQ